MELLQQAARRSLIMVTTRSKSAASVISTMPSLILSPLAFDDYWKMFKHFAFGSADESEDCTLLGDEWDGIEEEDGQLSPMEQTAYEIAQKMGRSPLEARVMGRSLYLWH